MEMSDESTTESKGAEIVSDGERRQSREISSRWVGIVVKKPFSWGADLERLQRCQRLEE